MHRTKNDNSNLLLLGGAAAVAALILMKQKTADPAATSGGGSGSDFLGGFGSPAYGSDAPTIYQIPADGGVTFPEGNGASLADLMALLGSGGPAPGETKKEAASTLALDAGAILPDGTVLKKPFVSIAQAPSVTTKKDAAVDPDPDYLGMAGSAVVAATPIGAAVGLWGVLQGFLNPQQNRFGGANGWGDGGNYGQVQNDMVRAPAGTVMTKKDSSVFGFSGQYVRDPVTGLYVWNSNSDSDLAELGGFGLSRDPKTGNVVSYQRDINIYGPSGKLYDATTRQGNPNYVLDAVYSGTYGTMDGYTPTKKEDLQIKANLARALPNQTIYSPISGEIVDTSKKSAAVAALPAPFVSTAPAWNDGGNSGSASSSGGSKGGSSSSGSSGSSSSGSSGGSFGGGSGWGGGGGGGKKGGGGAGGR